jgi:hypothetical protein
MIINGRFFFNHIFLYNLLFPAAERAIEASQYRALAQLFTPSCGWYYLTVHGYEYGWAVTMASSPTHNLGLLVSAFLRPGMQGVLPRT